jgi:hypothetical protein
MAQLSNLLGIFPTRSQQNLEKNDQNLPRKLKKIRLQTDRDSPVLGAERLQKEGMANQGLTFHASAMV